MARADITAFIDANTKGFDEAMARVRSGATTAGGAAQKSFVKTGGSVSNLAAQLNDIGVGLASGQSPFMVMVQQGAQVSQVLNDVTARGGSLKSVLLGAATGLISPISLATFAVIGLGGALLQYATGAKSGLSEADKALKAHADLIGTLKGLYGEASSGLKEYESQSIDVVRALARGNMSKLEDQIKSISAELLKASDIAVSDPKQVNYLNDLLQKRRELAAQGKDYTEVQEQLNKAYERNGEAVRLASSKYAPFQQAITEFVSSVNAGTPDVVRFRDEVSRIMNDNLASDDIQTLGKSILDMTDSADKSQRAMRAAEDAISLVGGAAAGQVDDVKALTAALTALSGIAIPALSNAEKIKASIAAGERAIGDETTPAGDEARRRLLLQAEAARLRIEAQQMPDGGKIPVPTKRPSLLDYDPNATSSRGGGRVPMDAYQRGVQSIEARTKALQAENAVLAAINPLENDYNAAVTQARVRQDLLNAAQRAGIAITPELTQNIDQIAASFTDASVQSQKLAESQREAQRAARDFANLEKDVVGGFIRDLEQGTSAADAFANALGKIADKLLDSGLDQLFGGGGGFNIFSLFGGGGGGGGWTGGQFGKAVGAVVSGGGGLFARGGVTDRPSIFGEAGPEAAVPLPDGRRIPVDLRGQGAGNVHVTVGVSVDDQGNLQAYVKDIADRSSANAVSSFAGSKNFTASVARAYPQAKSARMIRRGQ